MALIKCPECKKKVSDQCDRCPSCGYPIASNLDAIEQNNDYFLMLKAFIKRVIDTIRKRKQLRIALIAVCSVLSILLVIAGFVIHDTTANIRKFQLALEAEASREYAEAAMLYKELGNYIHRYKEYASAPVSAADKAKEAAFRQIAKDVRQSNEVAKVFRVYGDRLWHPTYSNYRYTIDEDNSIVVTLHLYAYYNVEGNRVQNRDLKLDSYIEIADYAELLGLTDENHSQIEAEWLAFMKETYPEGGFY